MNNIYDSQFFRLKIKTGIDLSGATNLKIKYINPNKESGEWPAVIDENDNMVLYSDIPALYIIGKWRVYANATFPIGNISGDPAYFIVVKEGGIK